MLYGERQRKNDSSLADFLSFSFMCTHVKTLSTFGLGLMHNTGPYTYSTHVYLYWTYRQPYKGGEIPTGEEGHV